MKHIKPHAMLLMAVLASTCLSAPLFAQAVGDGPEPVKPYLAKADAAAGEKSGKICLSCHNIAKGAGNKIGPNLWNVVNSPAAHTEGFSYSEAMKKLGAESHKWDDATLNDYLFNPKRHVAGTKMAFGGIKDSQDRANVIAWLHTLADKPAPLPK